MKRKQMLAFLMAGALTVGTVPYAAFAAEEAQSVSIDETAVAADPNAAATDLTAEQFPAAAAETPAAEAPTAETPAAETPVPEAPAAETPAPETPAPEAPAADTLTTDALLGNQEAITDIVADIPAETPAPETPAPETPAPETPAPETTVPETPAADNTQAAEEVIQEVQETEELSTDVFNLDPKVTPVYVVDQNAGETKGYEKLQDAINAIDPSSGKGDTVEHAVKIVLMDKIVLSETVAIGDKHVIIAAGVKDVTITRGEGFVGDFFTVNTGSLQLAAGSSEAAAPGTNEIYPLVVNGTAPDGTSVTGSLVHIQGATTEVEGTATFCLQPDVTLTGNNTSARGSAILNEKGGTILLTGGTITGNTTTYTGSDTDKACGAIYSTTPVNVSGVKTEKGGTETIAAGTIVVKDNTAGNIALGGTKEVPAYINILSNLTGSQINVTSVVGTTVAKVATNEDGTFVDLGGSKIADVIGQISYDGTGDFKIVVNEETGTGELGTEPPAPSISPSISPSITPSISPSISPSVSPSITPEASVSPTPEATATPIPTATPTPLAEKIRLKSVQNVKWTGNASAVLKFVSNINGYYYVSWNQENIRDKDGKLDKKLLPEFSVKNAVTSMVGGQTVTANLADINAVAGKNVNVFVFGVDEQKKTTSILVYTLKDTSRPADNTNTRKPLTPKVTESVIKGLDKALEFYPNTFYKFSVVGAGTQSSAEQVKAPVEGDVQWRPLYWSTSSNPSSSQKMTTWQIGAKNGIKDAATFNMYVFFQKYVYSGKEWQAQDSIEKVVYKFKSKEISWEVSGTPTPTIEGMQGYTGGDTYGEGEDGGYDESDPESREDDGSDTGESSAATNADTADNSPVGTMMMLASLSLLAGGYVLIRRRKKETI